MPWSCAGSSLEPEDSATDVDEAVQVRFGRARVVLALTVAAIVVFAFAGAVDAIAFFDEQADQSAAATPLDRAYGYDPDGPELLPDQEVVEDAVAAMAEDDPYRIVLGPRFRSILRIPRSPRPSAIGGPSFWPRRRRSAIKSARCPGRCGIWRSRPLRRSAA